MSTLLIVGAATALGAGLAWLGGGESERRTSVRGLALVGALEESGEAESQISRWYEAASDAGADPSALDEHFPKLGEALVAWKAKPDGASESKLANLMAAVEAKFGPPPEAEAAAVGFLGIGKKARARKIDRMENHIAAIDAKIAEIRATGKVPQHGGAWMKYLSPFLLLVPSIRNKPGKNAPPEKWISYLENVKAGLQKRMEKKQARSAGMIYLGE